MACVRMAIALVPNLFRERGDLALENLALRRRHAGLHVQERRPPKIAEPAHPARIRWHDLQ